MKKIPIFKYNKTENEITIVKTFSFDRASVQIKDMLKYKIINFEKNQRHHYCKNYALDIKNKMSYMSSEQNWITAQETQNCNKSCGHVFFGAVSA